MNADEIRERLYEEYNELIDQHDQLKELRREGSPFKTEKQLACEMDGLLEGIQSIEDVLNEIEENTDD